MSQEIVVNIFYVLLWEFKRGIKNICFLMPGSQMKTCPKADSTVADQASLGHSEPRRKISWNKYFRTKGKTG